MNQAELDPSPPLWPYQIYMDHNAKSGPCSEGRRYICSKATLEEAVSECQSITRASVLALYAPHMSAAELNYAYLESGVDPFIVGAPSVPFSAWVFARDCCCEITGELIEPPISAHPCDKKPPPHLISNPAEKPVIGSWRKDSRYINYLPNPYGEACRLAKMQGASAMNAFLNSIGEACSS
ncbi:hypothetical protein [Prosthecobacter sp.]|uniref:hypothetical protein n=1 Tax=Prosthecobacter sp. TaxID=1965333 RepID=UPI00378507FB